jgi:hypothetical protein
MEEACLGEAFVHLETGLMDFHEYFSTNAPPKQRVQLREVLKCAPLTTKDFVSGN